MEIRLEPLQSRVVNITGETVVYMSGLHDIEVITSNGQRSEFPSGSQVRFDKFNEVQIINKGDTAIDAKIIITEGEFRSLAEGSTLRIQSIEDVVDIRKITETLTAQVTNTVTANIANTITANIANTVDIRAITETLTAKVTNTVTANIANTVATLETPAISISTSTKAFTAGESYEIAVNTNRRDITIFAAETNTNNVTVAGIPLAAGQYVGLDNFTGAVMAHAVAANDQILITEVIK